MDPKAHERDNRANDDKTGKDEAPALLQLGTPKDNHGAPESKKSDNDSISGMISEDSSADNKDETKTKKKELVYKGKPTKKLGEGMEWPEEGWEELQMKRASGETKDRVDFYWYPVDEHQNKYRGKLDSLVEVRCYLRALEEADQDREKASLAIRAKRAHRFKKKKEPTTNDDVHKDNTIVEVKEELVIVSDGNAKVDLVDDANTSEKAEAKVKTTKTTNKRKLSCKRNSSSHGHLKKSRKSRSQE